MSSNPDGLREAAIEAMAKAQFMRWDVYGGYDADTKETKWMFARNRTIQRVKEIISAYQALSTIPSPTSGDGAREETIARKLAEQHFNRREWRGHCPKAERTAWLVDKYWPQWRDNAAELLALQAGGEKP